MIKISEKSSILISLMPPFYAKPYFFFSIRDLYLLSPPLIWLWRFGRVPIIPASSSLFNREKRQRAQNVDFISLTRELKIARNKAHLGPCL